MISTNPEIPTSKVRKRFILVWNISYILFVISVLIYGGFRLADKFGPKANQEKTNCIQAARTKVLALDLAPAIKSYFLHRLDEQGTREFVDLKDVQTTVDEAKTCVRIEPAVTEESAREGLHTAQNRLRDLATQKAALPSRQ